MNTLELHMYMYMSFGGKRADACCSLLCLSLTQILPYPIHTCTLLSMYWVDGVVGGAVTFNSTCASLWKQGNKEVRVAV